MTPRPGETFIDATIGYGGHASHLAPLLGPDGLYCGIDRDPQALEYSRQILSQRQTPFLLALARFDSLEQCIAEWKLPRVDGILFDLGVSSPQLDRPERGFSFQQEGPLDMRMDPESSLTAGQIVNHWDEKELASILRKFGEERRSRSVAHAIVQARKQEPIETTTQLADIVKKALRSRRVKGLPKEIHPATKTFQALRIAVNQELEQLPVALDQAIDCLSEGGRVAVLSYHSLEDRIVKRRFIRAAGACQCPPGLPECKCGAIRRVEILTRRPITPSRRDIEENPRCRSARLRIAKKLAEAPSSD